MDWQCRGPLIVGHISYLSTSITSQCILLQLTQPLQQQHRTVCNISNRGQFTILDHRFFIIPMCGRASHSVDRGSAVPWFRTSIKSDRVHYNSIMGQVTNLPTSARWRTVVMGPGDYMHPVQILIKISRNRGDCVTLQLKPVHLSKPFSILCENQPVWVRFICK